MEKKFGVNVFGFINGEFGLGEAVRLIINALQSANIPVALLNYDMETVHRHEDNTFQNFVNETPYTFNLVLLGPSEAKRILSVYGDTDFFKNKYNIFYLNWESEHFPQEYVDNISFYDEIWFPAKYCQQVIEKVSKVSVDTIPYPLEINLTGEIEEEVIDFYDKSCFNFLFIFDYNSTLERKNTLNLIEAFKIAFDKNDKTVALNIKTSRANRFQKEKQLLLDKIGDYQNIKIVEKIFEKNSLHNIIKGCDSYVSLHRSEGFGLTMMEAMYFSKPVIATGYSGNLQFMNSENSFLVNYTMDKVETKIINYDKNTIWSNPDVNHAAELMKLVRENSPMVQEIAKKGHQTVVEDFSNHKIGQIIKTKLEHIFENYKESPLKNDLIACYIENERLNKQLYIVNKSKLIKKILAIKLFFRNRKKKK